MFQSSFGYLTILEMGGIVAASIVTDFSIFLYGVVRNVQDEPCIFTISG